MKFMDWQRLQHVIFRPPERLDGLHLIFVDHAEQPHFSVDPAWPPRPSFFDSRHVPSHYRSREELAAEEQRRLDEETRRIQLLKQREELISLVEHLEAEDKRRLRQIRGREQRQRQELERLNAAHAKKIGRSLERRGVYTVPCPVCHAARFQKCVGTFHRSAHYERHQLAWPDRD